MPTSPNPTADWWSPERVVWNGPGDPQQQEKRLRQFRHAFRWFLDSLDGEPSKDWKVLEAGQGKYGWSHLYRQYFDSVCGADLRDFSAYHPGVESIVCDLCDSIPLPDSSFDLVVSHSVLEHVSDVPAVLASIDRILKRGRYAFLTVSPLFFSASGAHINHPVRLENWEHLDPNSISFMCANPMPDAQTKGHSLNHMKWSDFLGWLGQLPWSIVRTKLSFLHQELPAWLTDMPAPENDLRLKGFFLLARKEISLSQTAPPNRELGKNI